MELARNPAAFRELMRSQDRQLSNIEASGQQKGMEGGREGGSGTPIIWTGVWDYKWNAVACSRVHVDT